MADFDLFGAVFVGPICNNKYPIFVSSAIILSASPNWGVNPTSIYCRLYYTIIYTANAKADASQHVLCVYAANRLTFYRCRVKMWGAGVNVKLKGYINLA